MTNNAIKNDFIYIVLVKAHTGLGKVSRVLSRGYEYSHIAVCKDECFEDFITFSRRRHYAPFDAGFMHETRGCYCFGAHDRVKLKIFRLPVDPRGKRKVYRFLRHMERQQDQYLFNLYSMVTMPVLHGFMIDGAHNCMSFVGKVVELSGAVRLARPYYRYDIRTLDTLLTPYLYTERYFFDRNSPNPLSGKCTSDRSAQTPPEYMDRVPPWENIRQFFCLNKKLLCRVMKRGCNEGRHI